MKKIIAPLAILLSLAACSDKTDIRKVTEKVIENAPAYVDYGHYAGSVFTQSLAEYVATTGSAKYRRMAESIVDGFLDGSLKGSGSFISYYTGGTLIPEMVRIGYGKAADLSAEAARRMWEEQARNRDGIMLPPWNGAAEKNALFVDCVLAVTPYMLYAGLLENNQEYVDYAAWMALKTYEDLYDPSSGLVNQARAIRWMPEGQVTEDCWSRGNGWLSMGLAALLRDLPEDNRYRADIERISKDFFEAVLRWQDGDGLWHQEMTWHDSYVEISGTGLLLYGIGRAIEAGVLDRETALPAFRKGIAGMLRYVDGAGNVCNTCSGCLAWGDGTKAAYASHDYYCNERHAFGPVVFALTQALSLGIRKIDTGLGAETAGKIPACHARHIAERKGDIAWENDRAAFRIYSQEVKAKVSSGVDFWGKRVDYPILEQWYALNDKGENYHTDRGQGCDFYAVGKNRGLGGIGVWTGDELLVPEPYTGFEIIRDEPSGIAIRLDYPAIEKDGATYLLSEKIEMVLGTPFYKKTISLKTEGVSDVKIAVGLTDFGKAEVTENTGDGVLTLMEELFPSESVEPGKDGILACSVIPDPSRAAGFAAYGKDRLVLMDAGAEAVCYVGAGWGKDLRITNPQKRWPGILKDNSFETLDKKYK